MLEKKLPSLSQSSQRRKAQLTFKCSVFNSSLSEIIIVIPVEVGKNI